MKKYEKSEIDIQAKQKSTHQHLTANAMKTLARETKQHNRN